MLFYYMYLIIKKKKRWDKWWDDVISLWLDNVVVGIGLF